MKCVDVKDNLDALLDGEVEITQKRKIENHLETCVSCQAEFKNLRAVSATLKQHPTISAPALLDEKVFRAFRDFHAEKTTEKLPQEKNGWFGIPRFAVATTLILFALATISAFQLGRMSANEVGSVLPQVQEKSTSTTDEFAQDNLKKDENPTQTKIVEVPVVQKTIVKVPVLKEKIITKMIYVNTKNKLRSTVVVKNSLALKNSLENNGYITQTNLKGFQPVSVFEIKISKKEKDNE